jgi:hypothetical protein
MSLYIYKFYLVFYGISLLNSKFKFNSQFEFKFGGKFILNIHCSSNSWDVWFYYFILSCIYFIIIIIIIIIIFLYKFWALHRP